MNLNLQTQNPPTPEYRDGKLYAARFDLTYTDDNGKKQRLQRRENAKFHARGKQLTEKQIWNTLVQAVDERRKELAQELLNAPVALTHSTGVNANSTVREYFAWIDKKHRDKTTDEHVLERLRYKSRMVERYFLSEYGDTPVSQITSKTMTDWWAWFRAKQWRRPVYSPKNGELLREGPPRQLKLKTAENIAMLVSWYFSTIVRNKDLTTHPMCAEDRADKTEWENYHKQVEKDKLYLTSDQYSKYRELIREDDCYIALLINAELGLRIAEACEIDILDCDSERRIIKVKSSSRRVKGRGYVEKCTKSANGQRKLPMSPELCTVVEMRRREIMESGQLQTKLAMVNGNRVNPDHAIDRCAAILTKILGYRPTGTNITHCLRRTTNSKLSAFLTADVRSKALGHSEEVNANIYTQEDLAQIELIRTGFEGIWQLDAKAV